MLVMLLLVLQWLLLALMLLLRLIRLMLVRMLTQFLSMMPLMAMKCMIVRMAVMLLLQKDCNRMLRLQKSGDRMPLARSPADGSGTGGRIRSAKKLLER